MPRSSKVGQNSLIIGLILDAMGYMLDRYAGTEYRNLHSFHPPFSSMHSSLTCTWRDWELLHTSVRLMLIHTETSRLSLSTQLEHAPFVRT